MSPEPWLTVATRVEMRPSDRMGLDSAQDADEFGSYRSIDSKETMRVTRFPSDITMLRSAGNLLRRHELSD